MDKYIEALKTFEDEMLEYIEENFVGEKMSQKEAAYFLGQDISGWSKEDFNEAVKGIQLAYYTEGECSFEELVDKYLELQ